MKRVWPAASVTHPSLLRPAPPRVTVTCLVVTYGLFFLGQRQHWPLPCCRVITMPFFS